MRSNQVLASNVMSFEILYDRRHNSFTLDYFYLPNGANSYDVFFRKTSELVQLNNSFVEVRKLISNNNSFCNKFLFGKPSLIPNLVFSIKDVVNDKKLYENKLQSVDLTTALELLDSMQNELAQISGNRNHLMPKK